MDTAWGPFYNKRRADVLQIPERALFRKNYGWAVFVIAGKKAELRDVEVAKRSGLSAEIISGISEGEMVITHPDESISEGVRVKVRE